MISSDSFSGNLMCLDVSHNFNFYLKPKKFCFFLYSAMLFILDELIQINCFNWIIFCLYDCKRMLTVNKRYQHLLLKAYFTVFND